MSRSKAILFKTGLTHLGTGYNLVQCFLSCLARKCYKLDVVFAFGPIHTLTISHCAQLVVAFHLFDLQTDCQEPKHTPQLGLNASDKNATLK